MDINLLKTFYEVYRVRHFGKVAESLCITQSAVSARIQQLEENLGVKLFTRNRNNIEPTAAGLKMLPYVDTILITWSRLSQEVALVDQFDERLLLFIEAEPNIWGMVLQDWFGRLYAERHDIALLGSTTAAGAQLRRVLDGAINILFTCEPVAHDLCMVNKVYEMPLVLISAKETTAREALSKNYIYLDWGNRFSLWHAQQFPGLPVPKARLNDASLVAAMIARHGGTAYLPGTFLAVDSKQKLFEVEGAPRFVQEIYAVYRADSDRREVIENVLHIDPLQLR